MFDERVFVFVPSRIGISYKVKKDQSLKTGLSANPVGAQSISIFLIIWAVKSFLISSKFVNF